MSEQDKIRSLVRERNNLILMSSLSSLEPNERKRLKQIGEELSRYNQDKVNRIDEYESSSFPSKKRILGGF